MRLPKHMDHLKSSDVSKIDLIIRWGGWSRLSEFLPVPIHMRRYLYSG
jgi:undecaprenyl pyrophosphate synthase